MISPRKAKMVKQFIREPFTWPGCYNFVLITDDGCCICHECAKKNIKMIFSATKGDGWYPAAKDVIWEGNATCDECSKNVTVYGDPGEEAAAEK